MLRCFKTYKDIPFAHRQPLHKGACSKIHGHNWSITIEFEAKELDANGFVVDFGKLKYLKAFIDDRLDHACLIAKGDRKVRALAQSEFAPLFKIVWVDNASCEGIALYLYEQFSTLLKEHERDRVKIHSLRLDEDDKNGVTYTPESIE